jgi:hypothetical protein
VDLNDLAVPSAEAADALGDADVLAVLVRVPGGAGSGSEADGRDDHGLVALVGQRDRVEPGVAGELGRRVLRGRHGAQRNQ